MAFITLNALQLHFGFIIKDGSSMVDPLSKQGAHQIVVDFMKTYKNMERVDVSSVEQRNEVWVVRGTCPIYLEGHPWAEKFEIHVDVRGRIKSTDFSLL